MRLRTIGAWILINSLLLDNIFLPIDIGFDFRLQYIIFGLAIPSYLLLFNIKVNVKILFIILFFGVFLLITPLLSGTPLVGSIRQLLLVFVSAVPFYFMLSSYYFNVRSIFKIYLFTSLFLSIISCIQYISFIFHFKPGYDFSYLGFDMIRLDPESHRVQGLMMEPSFLAYFLMPATFFSLVRLFKFYETQIKFWWLWCVIILISMLLTNSLIAYVGVLIMLTQLVFAKHSFLKKPISLLVLGFLVVALAVSLYNIPAIKIRIDDTFKIFYEGRVDFQSVNLSTFHFYNNAQVSLQSVIQNPLIGAGFGNYYVMYNKFALPVTGTENLTPDGSSLFFRMITETGIPFTLFFLWFTFHFRLRLRMISQEHFKDAWVINNGVFILIIMRLIRMPHYAILGFPLFLILFYLTYEEHKIKLKTKHLTQ